MIQLSTLVIGDVSWTPQWWHFAPRAIPDDLARTFPVWDEPELHAGHRLADLVAGLIATTTHLLDLPTRDELDDLGRDLLAAYVSRIDPSPSTLVTDCARDIDLLSQAVATMGEAEPYRADLAEALEAVGEVITGAAHWDNEGAIPEDALRAWKPRIEQGVGLATAVRLAWSTAVLARTQP